MIEKFDLKIIQNSGQNIVYEAGKVSSFSFTQSGFLYVLSIDNTTFQLKSGIKRVKKTFKKQWHALSNITEIISNVEVTLENDQEINRYQRFLTVGIDITKEKVSGISVTNPAKFLKKIDKEFNDSKK